MADNPKNEGLLYFNGIDGSTGEYGLKPMTYAEFSKFILEEPTPENLEELEEWYKTYLQHDLFGLADDRDPENLAEAGWGVIFAHDADPAIKRMLKPLLDLRREQATKRKERYYKEYEYWPGDTKEKFLENNGAASFGPADPENMPYYLLIVGDPETIPYSFQYQLDVQYAVGRLHLDKVEDYAYYAQSVVSTETQGVRLPREAVFFGVQNEGDKATELSSNHLVQPLARQMDELQLDWQLTRVLKNEATKANLSSLVNGDQPPALLFTASHGMEFSSPDDPDLLRYQGALVCQDWPGPGGKKGLNFRDFCFSADDVEDKANLLGLIAFHFACFSAGSPRLDDFALGLRPRSSERVAPHAFVAHLPQRLLSNPRGGALAVLGHIDRAWSYSISYSDAKSNKHLGTFRSTLKRLLEGHPIGSATEYFNQGYAEYSTALTKRIEQRKRGNRSVRDGELVGLWTANNDARNYVILGDPAARLPVAQPEEAPSERPVIEVKPVAASSPTPPQAVAAAPAAPATLVEAEVEFGLREVGADIAGSLRNVSQKLVDILTTAVDDLTSQEVLTYTSEDLKKVSYDSKTHKFSEEARLQAMTRISLDGDLLILIPERKRTAQEGDETRTEIEIDERLWAIHREMVDLAQTSKTAFVKALAETVSILLQALR